MLIRSINENKDLLNNAFAEKIFEGNPASVCPLKEWLRDDLMQKIAQENNQSESAFFVKKGDSFEIRWFTPASEVDLCGHATLASAYVIYKYLNYKNNVIKFNSKSGLLKVKKIADLYQLDFPVLNIKKVETPIEIIKAFNKKPIECYLSMDYIVVFENEEDIININPNLEYLKELKEEHRGVIITSKSRKYDFICRFYAPKIGINEDPVTGSAFTQLIPYWSEKLNKYKFITKQESKRGGKVYCQLSDKRVYIAGNVVEYLEGYIEI